MKTYYIKFRIERVQGISTLSREENIQCINMNEAKELLARKYGVEKSNIAIITMKPL